MVCFRRDTVDVEYTSSVLLSQLWLLHPITNIEAVLCNLSNEIMVVMKLDSVTSVFVNDARAVSVFSGVVEHFSFVFVTMSWSIVTKKPVLWALRKTS
jgi:hypothetical protein